MENKLDDLVDVLIKTTNNKEADWSESSIQYQNLLKDFFDEIEEIYYLAYDSLTDIVIVKHAKYVIIEAEGQGYQQSVTLLLYNKLTRKIIIEINEGDINQPYRLWTLFKVVDRNVSGADELIDEIIKKFDPNRLSF